MRVVTIPQASLDDVMARLERDGQRSVGVCSASEYRRPGPGVLELLHRSTVYVGRSPGGSVGDVLGRGLLPVIVVSRPEVDGLVRESVNVALSLRVRTAAVLAFVGTRHNVEVHGCMVEDGRPGPIDYLSVPGPGMLRVGVRPLVNGASAQSNANRQNAGAPQTNPFRNGLSRRLSSGGNPEQGRRSRLAAAIGNGNLDRGYDYLERAMGLKVTVLGAGRAGSTMAIRLAQEGVGSHGGMVLADGDVVEEANLDTMILPPQAVGMPKAEAVALLIHGLVPDANVIPIVGTLSDRQVAEAVRGSDLIVSNVDDDATRVGATLLAVRYNRVHIDTAGGMAYVPGGVASGGEVRLVVPGTSGCVACFGRYSFEEAESILNLSREQEKRRRAQTSPLRQRPGSWGDVLLPVVGEALHLFWRLLRGEVTRSTWLHYEHAGNGRPVWQDWSAGRQPRCPVCGQQQGLGDLFW
jgi:hypothetical protein